MQQQELQKRIWPAAIALVLAIVIVILGTQRSMMVRLTNFDLAASGFNDTYVTYTKTDASKAYVDDRRDSTIRRSDRGQPGRKWDAFRFAGRSTAPGGEIWLVKSKYRGKGTVFFVPVSNIDDWIFPFLYSFIAQRDETLRLPRLEWTNLYVNRIYHGLYLRVALPFDLRKKDGGNGVLREIITTNEGWSSHVNTRFEDTPGVFADQVTESNFPELVTPSPRLAWLVSQNPSDETTVLMSDKEPFGVSLLPLPISLPELFVALNERAPAGYRDDRFRRWILWPPLEEPPFTDVELTELQAEFAEYAKSLRQAIRIGGEYHQNLAYFEEQLPLRQASGVELGLGLGAL